MYLKQSGEMSDERNSFNVRVSRQLQLRFVDQFRLENVLERRLWQQQGKDAYSPQTREHWLYSVVRSALKYLIRTTFNPLFQEYLSLSTRLDGLFVT